MRIEKKGAYRNIILIKAKGELISQTILVEEKH